MQKEIHCPHCGSSRTKYRGSYADPGYGNCYECSHCKKTFPVYAGKGEKEVRILSIEDVR